MPMSVHAVDTPNCDVCGATRLSMRTPQPFLCNSVYCASRYAALPANRKCGVCTRPLRPDQWAMGACASATCRQAWLVDRAIAGQRRLEQATYDATVAQRDRLAARRGIPVEERKSYRLAILPHNSERPSRLLPARREAFVTRLRASLIEARERLARGEAAPPPTVVPMLANGRTEAEFSAERALVGAACASCRGECCKQGGDHAFLRPDAMMAYLAANPTHDDEQIVSRYLALLPMRTLTNGCVFQQTDGCALPRDLRSDVCNRYFCEALGAIRHTFGPGEPVRAYLTHQKYRRPRPGVFVELPAD